MSTLSVVESVFLAALEKESPQERSAYLEEACANDANLRRAVERMLVAQARMGDFLQAPAPGLPVTTDHAPLSEKPGSVIGPYKLLQELGEGGFGVVFMAEQTEPVRRKVALKVIKPGMDSKQVVARFEQERQALAMMDHPHIARVFDGGTTESGRPYFVMELVKGIPITRFCDENRLNPRERLELFSQVCSAIQHAHTKGIIHRDIKPSNVLVTMYDDKPVVKVIDFGVAKAIEQKLTEGTLFTRVGQVIGTLEYMSPEQASLNALDVDTRSDVYALGVLLYELLTGSTPLDKEKLRSAGFAEMLRLIREEEPQRPSDRISGSGVGLPALAAYRKTQSEKLPALVRGELDWITLKALEKDRVRRYQSALGLAEDVARYLRDEQVLACPPSWGYRAGKFLRKHKAAFTLTGTVATLLFVGAVVSGCLAWWAIGERKLKDGALVQAQDDRDEAHRRRIAAEAAETKEKAARLTTRRAFYAQTMTLIAQAWEANDTRRAARLLEELRPGPDEPDLRGFEWHYWDRQLHQERSSKVITRMPLYYRLPNDAVGVALSGDGARVAFFCYPKKDGDALVKVVDAASGAELLSLQAGDGRRGAACLTLNQDGSRLAFLLPKPALEYDHPHLPVSDHDLLASRVEVWDVDGEGDKPIFTKAVERKAFLTMLSLSPDGKRLATAEAFSDDPKRPNSLNTSAALVKVWTLARPAAEPLFRTEVSLRRENLRLGVNVPWAFNPDGSRLAMESNGAVEVWDLASGKPRGKLPITRLDEFGSLAFSPNGKRLAAVMVGRDNNNFRQAVETVCVWDGADGDELKEIMATRLNLLPNFSRYDHPWKRLAYSPDGRFLAVSGDSSRLRLFDAEKGTEVRTLQSINNPLIAAFNKDGTRLLSIGYDVKFKKEKEWVWEEWDVVAPIREVPVQPWPRLLTVHSRDGERHAVFQPSEELIRKKTDDDQLIAIRDRVGKEVQTFREHGKVPLHSLAFSPNGRFVLSVDSHGDRTCLVWEAKTGDVVSKFFARPGMNVRVKTSSQLRGWLTLNHPMPISRDGRLIVVRDEKTNEVKVVEFDDQKVRFGVGQATEAYFSHDSRRLITFHATDEDLKKSKKDRTTFKVWDVEDGREIASYSRRDANVSFTTDGHWYLVRKEGESALVLEEVGAAESRHVLKGINDPDECEWLLFSPDGTRLVTSPDFGFRDYIPNRVWEVASGKELAQVLFPPTVISPLRVSMTFSADSKRIAGVIPVQSDAGEMNAEVKVWDAITGRELLKREMPSTVHKLVRATRTPKVSFTPDGNLLTLADRSRSFAIWDATPRSAAK